MAKEITISAHDSLDLSDTRSFAVATDAHDLYFILILLFLKSCAPRPWRGLMVRFKFPLLPSFPRADGPVYSAGLL